MYGTLIALLRDGVPILGIIDQPFIRERWVGAVGLPTQYNGKPVHTRKCTALDSAYLYASSPDMFVGPTMDSFEKIRAKVWRGESKDNVAITWTYMP